MTTPLKVDSACGNRQRLLLDSSGQPVEVFEQALRQIAAE